jgi:hypothetical protein
VAHAPRIRRDRCAVVSATVSTPVAGRWLRTLCSGGPHQIISDGQRPYLLRWYLLRSRWLNFYLHKFVGSDAPSGLHDHPWPFATLILGGSYTEDTPTGRRSRRRGTLAVHRATYRHRVCLPVDTRGREIPCWTLVVTGPHLRQWGFWCPHRDRADRFIPWQVFGDGGCGETEPAT